MGEIFRHPKVRHFSLSIQLLDIPALSNRPSGPLTMSKLKILGKIRAAKKTQSISLKIDDDPLWRIQNHPKNLVPKRGEGSIQDRIDIFCREAKLVQTTISCLQSRDLIPGEIAVYLQEHNLKAEIRCSLDLEKLPWTSTLLKVKYGPANSNDLVGVTNAMAGVAETGTVVVNSGRNTPVTLNFLPLTNIVILESTNIIGTYEDVWEKVRKGNLNDTKSTGFMPRTINFITGPSRSADIEQTLLLGVHGPSRLHVIIVNKDLR